jgi:outer membrane protein assembly factor BamE
MFRLKLLLIVILALAGTGCNYIYKIDIQQGNVLDQKRVDELRPGMTKRQVTLVLGTPAVASPFRHDRWDYIATYMHRGERISRKVLSLSFEDNRLVRIEGDYLPEASDLVDEAEPDAA